MSLKFNMYEGTGRVRITIMRIRSNSNKIDRSFDMISIQPQFEYTKIRKYQYLVYCILKKLIELTINSYFKILFKKETFEIVYYIILYIKL